MTMNDRNKHRIKAQDDVPKYRKKKQSSVSKSKIKSKHKHQYIDCLLIDKNKNVWKSKYCSICGKLHDLEFFQIEALSNKLFRMLENHEIMEKYNNVERFKVKNIMQKYIDPVADKI